MLRSSTSAMQRLRSLANRPRTHADRHQADSCNLQDVAAPTAEDKDVATERVLDKRRLHQRRQTIEALPHVGVAGDNLDAGSRWQANHARLRKAVNTLRRLASSTGPRSRARALPISVSMVPVLERAGGAGGVQ